MTRDGQTSRDWISLLARGGAGREAKCSWGTGTGQLWTRNHHRVYCIISWPLWRAYFGMIPIFPFIRFIQRQHRRQHCSLNQRTTHFSRVAVGRILLLPTITITLICVFLIVNIAAFFIFIIYYFHVSFFRFGVINDRIGCPHHLPPVALPTNYC